MIAFWIAALLATGACAALVYAFAMKPAGAGVDPEKSVYLRQLGEIDDLADRGLLGEEERRSAHAEAARRLLRVAPGTEETGPTKGVRLAVAGAIAGLVLIAAAAYLAVGSPGKPDLPYEARLKAWQANPASINAQEMAAVLKGMTRDKPNDVELLTFLARAQAEAGDGRGAIRSVRNALKLQPARADLWFMLGQLELASSEGDAMSPEARDAFVRALALKPDMITPRYLLAKQDILDGRVKEGLAAWRAMLPELPPQAKPLLEREIAAIEKSGGMPGQVAPGQVDPAIQAMVDRLATRMKTNPDDPAGWARLVRSYAVLKDKAKLDEALSIARNLFKDRPTDLAAIEAAADINQQSR